uniref:RING-type domain-containing protein n=1 Tax=viral metagenome TaxID=1070528 RepID=A0A6C0EPS1_9ZZZZ
MQCAICLNKIENVLFLTCAHGFCRNCVIMLIKKRTRKCPICRTKITWTIPQISCCAR